MKKNDRIHINPSHKIKQPSQAEEAVTLDLQESAENILTYKESKEDHDSGRTFLLNFYHFNAGTYQVPSAGEFGAKTIEIGEPVRSKIFKKDVFRETLMNHADISDKQKVLVLSLMEQAHIESERSPSIRVRRAK